MRLILASGSPRRRELLGQAGFAFEVHAADIDESAHKAEDPVAYVTRLARAKATAVFDALGDSEAVVLGADTIVTLDGTLLGKPADEADAARMLRLLSGRSHRVMTGVAVVSSTHTDVAAEVTAVRFLTMSDAEIADYIATGEPMDKAGAYAIQGRAARWIPRVDGCYFNVVGLPVALASTMLSVAMVRSTNLSPSPQPE